MSKIVPVVLALVLVACSGGSKDAPALKHAKAACGHWKKINTGISDVNERATESRAFQSEAQAAATADARYKALQTAADSWLVATGSSTSPESIDALRSAIDQARAACADVTGK